MKQKAARSCLTRPMSEGEEWQACECGAQAQNSEGCVLLSAPHG